MLRKILVTILILFLWSPLVQGQAKKSEAKPKSEKAKAASGKDEKLDISDLEQKYWAPKDTDFSVVQNRTYSKNKRFSVSFQLGPLINDQFSKGNFFALSGNYFFSERHGMEVSYYKADLENNEATVDLTDFGGGVSPNFGRINQYFGLGYSWVPFYAKMSVLGKKIIYFDMAFTPHLGLMEYDQILRDGNSKASALTYGFDITQYFFLSKHIAVRVDLKNRWFDEEVKNWNDGTNFKDGFTNTTMFLIGVTYYH